MGGVVGDVIGGIGDLGQGAIDTVKDVAESDLGKAAILAGAAYFGAPYLMGEGAVAGTGLTSGGGLGLTGAGTTAYGGLGAGLGSTLGTEAALTSGLAGSTVGGLGLTAGGTALGGLGAGLGASTLAGGTGAAAGGLGLGSLGWGSALGAGMLASKALGGSQPTSSTSSTSIDPQMKEAYLRNLEEARLTAAGLGQRQFAAFPEYSTNMVQKYMNPYQQEVINATMSDLERQRQQQQIADLNAATRARAFGGSRQGVAEALTNEAAQRTAASTLANLRSQGFTQAQGVALQQEQARQAYEQQKLDAARNLGLERLNIASGALGLQPANLGGTQTTPIYRNTSASALGGALSGGMLGNMIGGSSGAGYGALAGGLLGLL
jgi:hypothetical protein